MSKRIIKLTESQLRDIVQKVITQKVLSEQTAPVAGGVSFAELSQIASNLNYWMTGDVQTNDLNKITNELKTKVFGKTAEDGGCALTKVIAYYEKIEGNGGWKNLFGTTAGLTLSFSEWGRTSLISDIQKSTEGGEPQFEDVKKQLISAINAELSGFCKTTSTAATGSTTGSTATTTTDPWANKSDQERVNGVYCSVVNGIITVERPDWKGKKWDDYVTQTKLTPQEIATAKASCPQKGGVANTVRNPDPKVMELQKQIKAALPNFNLGTTGPNKDGIDGIMGPRTREGQRLMSGNQSQSQPNTYIGNDMKTTYDMNDPAQKDAYFKQAFQPTKPALKPLGGVNTQLTPQQQADIDKIKAGTPTPTTPVAPIKDPYADLG